MRRLPLLIGLLALLAAGIAVWQLERQRAGLTIAPLEVTGGPPATLYLRDGAGPAPVVVVAHGFAGSRPLMEAFSITLAQAGYMVAGFDFMGHGRNPAPIRGDVTRIDGTTLLMAEEVAAVAEAALAHPRADGRLALVGHSMASDIVIRAGQWLPETGAVVAVSMFSRAVTPESPPNLLVIAGDWEAGLKIEALRALHLSDPAARPGQLVGEFAAGTARKVVFSPMVEHVGVLYSATTLRETRDWLDATFAREASGGVAMRGGWIVLLLVAVTALAWPLARALPASGRVAPPVPGRVLMRALLLPGVFVPLVLWPMDTRFLPVLVADYLALHMLAWGAIALVILWRNGLLRGVLGRGIWPLALVVAVYAIVVFGGVIDRYVTSFVPHSGRLLVIAGLVPGAVLMMLADGVMTQGGRAALARVWLVRVAFLCSLMLAVMLDFAGLMFLLIILPIIAFFFLLFGTMAGWIGRQTGQPAIAGIAFGLMLAWSLGVTFPMFAG